MFARYCGVLRVAVFVVFAFFGIENAHAGDLIYDNSCMALPSASNQLNFLAADQVMGLTCENLRQYKEDVDLIRIALIPLGVAMNTPQAKEMLAAGLLQLGLEVANPPVLAVTFLGSVGVSTVYFLLKREMKECEKEERNQLRDEILRELKASLPVKNTKPVELEIQH